MSDLTIELTTIIERILLSLKQTPGEDFRGEIPREVIPLLVQSLREKCGAQVELLLANDTREINGNYTLTYLFSIPKHTIFIIIEALVPADDPHFPSIALQSYLSSRFERKIHDLFGLIPDDHPDLRRLPLHQFWPEGYYPLRKDAVFPEQFSDNRQPFAFRQIQGEGLHEVVVGPIHAGIIEPGHFRFTVEGEMIVNLESRLYYVHKGIEKLFETLPLAQTLKLAERISGDSSVGHTLAYCQALERIAGITIPPAAALIRVIVLELERLYNHIMDTGMICGDAGFAFAQAHAARLREDLLRLNERISGHRLLRGILTPGGVLRTLPPDVNSDIINTIEHVNSDFQNLMEIALSNSLVLDRLHKTGQLFDYTAREMQVVGLVGRASGIDADVRRDYPFAAYGQLAFNVPVFHEGDVWARTMMRLAEIKETISLIKQAITLLEPGDLAVSGVKLPLYTSNFGLVEGWRGPILHWVMTGPADTLFRYKIKDPSFANWPALNYAVLTNIIPDFPICNKSFNLSYAGNDL